MFLRALTSSPVLQFHSKELKGANFINQICIICQIRITGSFVCVLRVWPHLRNEQLLDTHQVF